MSARWRLPTESSLVPFPPPVDARLGATVPRTRTSRELADVDRRLRVAIKTLARRSRAVVAAERALLTAGKAAPRITVAREGR